MPQVHRLGGHPKDNASRFDGIAGDLLRRLAAAHTRVNYDCIRSDAGDAMTGRYLPRWWLAAGCLFAAVPTAHATQRGHHAAERAVHPVAARAEAPVQDAAAKPAGFIGESGTASYYGPRHNGHRTAAGTRFDQTQLTAAHPWLPFGTKVRVTLAETGRSVVVVITDRLYSSRRVVDLSLAAAEQLGMIRQGIATVTLSPA